MGTKCVVRFRFTIHEATGEKGRESQDKPSRAGDQIGSCVCFIPRGFAGSCFVCRLRFFFFFWHSRCLPSLACARPLTTTTTANQSTSPVHSSMPLNCHQRKNAFATAPRALREFGHSPALILSDAFPFFALTYTVINLLGSVQAIGFCDLVPFSHGVLRKYR